MNAFAALLQTAGSWHGRNRVQTSISDPANESASRLIVTPILGETFLRLDQTWSWQDQPQEGSLLIGYNPKTEAASLYWIDTWHNGHVAMLLTGRFDASGRLIVNGHFPAPPEPDWGWRIEIAATMDRLQIEMACIEPTGRDNGGVWSEFTRD